MRSLHDDLIAKARDQANLLGIGGSAYIVEQPASARVEAGGAPMLQNPGRPEPRYSAGGYSAVSTPRPQVQDAMMYAETPAERPMVERSWHGSAAQPAAPTTKEILYEGVDLVAANFRTAAERDEYMHRARRLQNKVAQDQDKALDRQRQHTRAAADADRSREVSMRRAEHTEQHVDQVRHELMQTKQDVARLQQHNHRLKHQAETLSGDRNHHYDSLQSQRSSNHSLDVMYRDSNDRNRRQRREGLADEYKAIADGGDLKQQLEAKQRELEHYKEQLDSKSRALSEAENSYQRELHSRRMRCEELERVNDQLRAQLHEALRYGALPAR